MPVHLVNPNDNSFGIGIIVPRWLYVLAAATPERFGVPAIVDETLDQLDPAKVAPGDVVGIGIHTLNALRGYEVGRMAKERGAQVIYGGVHASLYPEEPFERGAASAVVRGDGDVVWARALEDADRGTFSNASTTEAASKPTGSFLRGGTFCPADRYMMASVQTVRGCPKHCSFCSVWRTDGQKPRQRASDAILEEVVQLRRMGFRFILLADDNFYPVTKHDLELAAKRKDTTKLEELTAIRNERFELMERLSKLPHDMVFLTQITMEAADDPEYLQAMKRARVKGALVGMESVTAEGLKAIYKDFNSAGDNLVEKLQTFVKNDVHVLGSFIFGLPTDRPETFGATAALAQEAGIAFAQFVTLTPFPGTVDFQGWEKSIGEQGRTSTEFPSTASGSFPKPAPEALSSSSGDDPRGDSKSDTGSLEPFLPSARGLEALGLHHEAPRSASRTFSSRSSFLRCTPIPASPRTAPAPDARASGRDGSRSLAGGSSLRGPCPSSKCPPERLGSPVPPRKDPVEEKRSRLNAAREVAGLQALSRLFERVSPIGCRSSSRKPPSSPGSSGRALSLPDLLAAFRRFLADPSKDKGCLAKIAIAEALTRLEHEEAEIFLEGIRHMQREPVWGGTEDTAAWLRGLCAIGLAGCRHPRAAAASGRRARGPGEAGQDRRGTGARRNRRPRAGAPPPFEASPGRPRGGGSRGGIPRVLAIEPPARPRPSSRGSSDSARRGGLGGRRARAGRVPKSPGARGAETKLGEALAGDRCGASSSSRWPSSGPDPRRIFSSPGSRTESAGDPRGARSKRSARFFTATISGSECGRRSASGDEDLQELFESRAAKE